MKRLFAFVVLISFIMGCEHEFDGERIYPQVFIAKPLEDQQFFNGDTIRITGYCTDNVKVDEVGVHITDKANNQEFFHNHYSLIHADSFPVNTYHVVNTSATTRYIVGIEVTDPSGNKNEKEVEIKIN